MRHLVRRVLSEHFPVKHVVEQMSLSKTDHKYIWDLLGPNSKSPSQSLHYRLIYSELYRCRLTEFNTNCSHSEYLNGLPEKVLNFTFKIIYMVARMRIRDSTCIELVNMVYSIQTIHPVEPSFFHSLKALISSSRAALQLFPYKPTSISSVSIRNGHPLIHTSSITLFKTL